MEPGDAVFYMSDVLHRTQASVASLMTLILLVTCHSPSDGAHCRTQDRKLDRTAVLFNLQ